MLGTKGEGKKTFPYIGPWFPPMVVAIQLGLVSKWRNVCMGIAKKFVGEMGRRTGKLPLIPLLICFLKTCCLQNSVKLIVSSGPPSLAHLSRADQRAPELGFTCNQFPGRGDYVK